MQKWDSGAPIKINHLTSFIPMGFSVDPQEANLFAEESIATKFRDVTLSEINSIAHLNSRTHLVSPGLFYLDVRPISGQPLV